MDTCIQFFIPYSKVRQAPRIIGLIIAIAPEISLPTILKGALSFMLCIVLGIIILSIFPEIATWLPDQIMGPAIPVD